MVSCYLLLGGPWYEENRASYNSLANTYTVKRDNTYVLHPVEKKLFRSWRKERLLKKKETTAAIFAPSIEPTVQPIESTVESVFANLVVAPLGALVEVADETAVLKTDSKPRTVSFEEGEDDTAPNTVYCSVRTHATQDIEDQVSTLHYFGARRNIKEGFDIYVSHCICGMHARRRDRSVNYIFDPGICYQDQENTSAWDLNQEVLLVCTVARRFSRRILSLCATGWGPPAETMELETVHQDGLIESFTFRVYQIQFKLEIGFYVSFLQVKFCGVGYYIKPAACIVNIG
jgi:hypothetical protein